MTTLIAQPSSPDGTKKAHRADPLCLTENGLLWVRLPHDAPTNLYFAGNDADEKTYKLIDEVRSSFAFDRLAVVHVKDIVLPDVKAICDQLKVPENLNSSPPARLAGAELVRWSLQQDSGHTFLKRIARVLSSALTIPLPSSFVLADAIQSLTMKDFLDSKTPGAVVFARSSRLQQELREVLRERPLVFLLGGFRAGKSAFVETMRPESTGLPRHVTVEFDEYIYEEFGNLTTAVDEAVGSHDRNPFLHRLLAALAYGAFKASYDSNAPLLENDVFVRHGFPDALANPRVFGLAFLGSLRSHRQPIVSFMHFFKVLTELANDDNSDITIFLPFARLGSLLSGGAHESRVFWDVLFSLRKNHFDAAGHLKCDSELKDSVGRLGLVITVEVITFERVAEAVLMDFVLVLPPMDREELRRCMRMLFLIEPSDRDVEHLIASTGGIPWLVAIALECACLVGGDIPHAVNLISDLFVTQTNSEPKALEIMPKASQTWIKIKLYKLKLLDHLRMGDALVYGHTVGAHPTQAPFDQLNADADLFEVFKRESAIRRLFTAGLLWLLPPREQNQRLRAFRQIPYVGLAPRAGLVVDLLKSIEVELTVLV